MSNSIALLVLRKLLSASIPFAGSLACAHGLTWFARAAFVLGFAAVLLLANPLRELSLLLAGWLYLTLAALGTYGLTRAFPEGVPSRVALLAMLAYVFVVAPRSVLGESAVMVQPIGWEMAFAAYSFCIETARPGRRGDLRSCLFFILVNPVLAFPDRGREDGTIALRGRALLRVAAGMGSWAAKFGLLNLTRLVAWLGPVPLRGAASGAGYLRFTAHHGVRVLAGYAGHSGRASVHIGWMGLLGHSIPERYDWPLLARTPVEFWRRWNTYVGSWLRRYVFTPLSLWLKRRHRRWPAFVLTSLAVLVAFSLMGLAHDFALAAAHTARSLDVTVLFVVHGAVLLCWAGATRLGSGQADSGMASFFRRASALGGWLALMHLLALSVWWMDDSSAAVSGQRMAELGSLLSTGDR